MKRVKFADIKSMLKEIDERRARGNICKTKHLVISFKLGCCDLTEDEYLYIGSSDMDMGLWRLEESKRARIEDSLQSNEYMKIFDEDFFDKSR